MRALKKYFILDLEDGMVVGEDILTDSGIMVIPAGVVITRPIVAHLMSLGVDEVIIDDSVQAAGQDETLSAEQYVDENATVDQPAIEFYEPNNDNFKKFSKEYSDTKDKLNKTFESFIEKTISKDDVEKLIDDSFKLIIDNGNSYGVMGMLYSMHNYSDHTYMHCVNVGIISAMIGRWLGWSDKDVRMLNACGMFHDIGKLLIPSEILDKPGKLTDEEYAVIQNHTIKGYKLLKEAGVDPRIANCALMHHERYDGKGYPLKITGDKMDRFARVVAIADVYEAMTANRKYRGPMCPFDVIAQFENEGFSQFDTEILFVFLRNIVDSYLYSKVELTNGDTAEIVLINHQAGSKPVVLTSSGKTVNLMTDTSIKIRNVI